MSGKRGSGTAEERIVDYLGGMSLNAVARKYGVSNVAIRAQLISHGIERRPTGRAMEFLNPEMGAEVKRRYAAGESQEAIGKAMGCSQAKVSRVLAAAGVPTGAQNWRGRHWAWKGGRQERNGGIYVALAYDDPLAEMRSTSGYVAEHRLVMARHLGRPLTRSETVHHINGDRMDNRLENLQLRQGRHGKGSAHRCLDCGSTNIESAPLTSA